jgi:hypothetical protein
MWKNPRVTHCRFNKSIPIYKNPKQNNKFDRVVSIAWNYDSTKSVIIYGATVFKHTSVEEQWTKKLHSKTALERYNNCPVKVMMINTDLDNFSTDYIDWYIAQKLIYDYGCKSYDNELFHVHVHQTNDQYKNMEDKEFSYNESNTVVRNDASCLIYLFLALLATLGYLKIFE